MDNEHYILGLVGGKGIYDVEIYIYIYIYI